LKEVEICSRSGLLATDKCYDAVKGPTGDSVQKRTTYMEIATNEQMPTEPCNVHGEPRARIVVETASGEAPRAQLATDLSEVRPIILKAPTLLAQNDPYNSVKSTIKVDAVETEQTANDTQSVNNQETVRADVQNQRLNDAKRDASKPVLRAIPVEPEGQETPVEVRRALPVGPMDEVDQGALLKAVTPPPAKSPDE
jgi:hypothetical protein